VGFGPVFFPSERRFGHRSVHTQPGPVDPLQFVKLGDARLPEVEKDARFDPGLKPIVRGGFGTQVGLVQCLPLAAGAENVKNGIGTAAIWDPWTATTKAVGVHSDGEPRCQHRPQGIGNAKPSGRAVVWDPCSTSFWAL